MMTEEDFLLLNELKANTQQLFRTFEQLEGEKVFLNEQIEVLKQQIRKLEEENSELSRKNEQLKVATRILSGVDENRLAKQKINKLVREIDKCIALLNG